MGTYLNAWIPSIKVVKKDEEKIKINITISVNSKNFRNTKERITEKIDPKNGAMAKKEFFSYPTKTDWNAADGANRLISIAKTYNIFNSVLSNRRKSLMFTEKI